MSLRQTSNHRARDSEAESTPFFVSGRYEHPQVSGGDLEEATPDPIPNSEVKLLGADGTAREAVWESRTLPGLLRRAHPMRGGPFFCPRRPGMRRAPGAR